MRFPTRKSDGCESMPGSTAEPLLHDCQRNINHVSPSNKSLFRLIQECDVFVRSAQSFNAERAGQWLIDGYRRAFRCSMRSR
jgi:hypothetical protein